MPRSSFEVLSISATMLRAVSTACLAAALAVTVTIFASFWVVACVAVAISLALASTAPRISVAPCLASATTPITS